MNELEDLVRTAQAAFVASSTANDLENAKAQFLGKSGRITELMKGMAALSVEEKKTRGAAINAAKQAIEGALNERRQALADAELQAQLKAEALDVTLPGRQRAQGGLHPVSLTLERIEGIFGSMGFEVADGPEIETDWFNFTALNTPADHPARSMHDTFYVEGGHLLRTHTSPMQIRHAVQHVKRYRDRIDAGQGMPEIRVIAPGRTYRVDSDATHSPMFHQVEALVIDEGINLGHLKWTVEEFCKAFFEIDKIELRARPSFFPFTEPSLEWDMRCDRSVPGKITFGTGNDWLELGSSGMVHRKVLENCGIDSGRYQGFAFGFGLDRMAMLKYSMPDIRSFFEADLRWLKHYGFAALDLPTLDGGLSK